MAKKSKTEETGEVKDYTYFHQRLDVLGWTESLNEFETPSWEFSSKEGWRVIPETDSRHRVYRHRLFDADSEGNLVINFYRITGAPATYRRGDGPAKNYYAIRYRNPVVGKDGELIRFKGPSGTSPLPWFGPRLIEAFRNGEQIECLTITEGPLKAFAGEVAGAHIMAVPGITQVRDPDKHLDQLHQDIVDLIQRCRPKKVVWLMDGDVRHFPRGWDPETEEGREKDLFQKPNSFYCAVRTMRDLLQDLANEIGFSAWFKHVLSDDLPRHPKGLDDLLVDIRTNPELSEQERQDALDEVLRELVASSGPSHYFYRKSLDRISEIKRYFAIGSAQEFYTAHEERLKEHTFVFHGTRYRYDTSAKELTVVMPAVMRNYVRVGDTYYERVKVPNRYGMLEEKLHRRDKTTITDDHGKDQVKHIQKFKAFCNVPSHENYQPIIANCWNRYQPMEHTPEPGDWPHIQMFLRHIFGSGTVEKPHPKKRDANGHPVMMRVSELDLGYDYLQLLYRNPTQILPILCLVSRARETGKSTFGKLVKAIFTGNAAFVSSNDLQSDFNEHWISKLVVICEEAFLDKKQTIERIKDLSTASVAMLNSKGIQQQEIEVFLHFIINSNNTRNFITTDSDEIRFWVREVPRIPDAQKVPKLEDIMQSEIPAFLHFLSNRTMATEELSRMWFHPSLLETEALHKVREHSRPMARREIEAWMRQMFLATRKDEIRMTVADVRREVFRGSTRYDDKYLREIFREEFDAQTPRKNGHPSTCTYSYPRLSETRDMTGTHFEVQWVDVRTPSRPYIFRREVFFTEQDWEMLTTNVDDMVHPQAPAPQPVTPDADDDDLPF